MKVIDFHSHFPTSYRGKRSGSSRLEKYGAEKLKLLREQSQQYRNEWRKVYGFEPAETETHTDEEQAARWIKDLDEKGVERVNFVTGGGNDNLAKIVKAYPSRFTGFAHHSMFSEDAPAELERAVKELGLKGYKIIASSQTRPIDDKSTYTFWETVEKLDIPVIIHFGVTGGGGSLPTNLKSMNPLTLWEIAKMFPKITFVVPHFGAGYLRELLLLCWFCRNVSIDTSGSNQWMTWMPFELDLKSLFRRAIESVGPDRIIFGTDSSYFPRGLSLDYLGEQLKVCRLMGLEETSIEKIFNKNAAKLLKLDT
jgi:predicted TIM-barrel fold metal-dependent hydrolase